MVGNILTFQKCTVSKNRQRNQNRHGSTASSSNYIHFFAGDDTLLNTYIICEFFYNYFVILSLLL